MALNIDKSYHRIYVSPQQLNATIKFYQTTTQAIEKLRLEIPTPKGVVQVITLESSIQSFAIVSADDGVLPDLTRQTNLTWQIDGDLQEALDTLREAGAEQLEDIVEVAGGRRSRVRTVDGSIIEIVSR